MEDIKMKKMVCEICDSQKIKKENGIFVCQDCGTEYSLDEAKQLLKEINSERESTVGNKITIVEENNKYLLVEKLLCWLKYINNIDDLFRLFNEIHAHDTDLWYNQITKDYLISKLKLPTPRSFENRIKDKAFMRVYIECFELWEGAEFNKEKYDLFILNSFTNYIDSMKNKFALYNIYTKAINVPEYIDGQKIVGISEYLGNMYALFKKSYNVPKELEFVYWCLMGYFIPERDIKSSSYIKKGLLSSKNIKFDPGYDEIKTVSDIKTIINDAIVKYTFEYNEIIDSYIDNCIQIFNDLMSHKNEYEEMFNLPIKYRNSKILISLIEIIIDGKANDWMSAINIFETEKYRLDVINSLNKINDSIIKFSNIVKKELSQLNSNLILINKNLERINSSIDDVEFTLNKISFYSKLQFLHEFYND